MLQTDRLQLREISFTDLDNVDELHSLPETDEFNTRGIPDSIQTTERIMTGWLAAQHQARRTSYVFCTEEAGTKLFIGIAGLNLHRVEAGCATENGASIKVLERAGMIREGRKRKKLPVGGAWIDNYFYAILEEDFFK